MRTWTNDDRLSEDKMWVHLAKLRSRSLKAFVLVLSFLVSIILPLILFLIYQTHAKKAGIVLQTGCEGVENLFGMLSGVLMALQLRYVTRN